MTTEAIAVSYGRDGDQNRTAIAYPDIANADLLSRIPAGAATILDVGCGTGALGFAYRDINPQARLLGIERDPDAAALAGTRLDAVACVDVEQNPLPFEFSRGIDCLIYGDILQQLRAPWTVVQRHLEVLNPGGTVLICVPNTEHWSIAARLLRGTWNYEGAGLLDVHHLRCFTLHNLKRALTDTGLIIREVHSRIFAPEQARHFIQMLAAGLPNLGIGQQEYAERAMPLQYVLCAERANLNVTTVTTAQPAAPGKTSGETTAERPQPLPRDEIPATAAAAEIVYFERSAQFTASTVIELGPTFTEQAVRPFMCPSRSAEVRAFRFQDVALNTACMLLFCGGLPIKDTHYLLHDEQFRNARIERDRLVYLPSDRPYIIGCNRDHTNYYHWLVQALPAVDWGVRTRSGERPCLALPSLAPWQERSLELLGLAALPRLTLDPASHYQFPDVEYSEFLNGRTAFEISLRAIETFRRMKAAVPARPTGKPIIYVARTDTKSRVAVNEAELISRLSEEGVDIIIPGSLTLDEQINIFRNARLVIGAHGAGLSNVVFCDPEAVLYELIPDHYRNCCMNRLALAAGLHYAADLFPSPGKGWVHHRTWSYDIDTVVTRVRVLKNRTQFSVRGDADNQKIQDSEMPLKTLLMNFESLGDNCEFGLVQRRASAEPLGLLRFASPYVPVEIRPRVVTDALRNKFDGLGEPSTIRLTLEGDTPPREIVVRESAYQLMHHTFKHEGEVDLESFRLQEAKRLTFLRGKLLTDLAAAEKIWVWKSNHPISNEHIDNLLDAITAYGPNVLLWVVTADADHPPGSAERVSDSLLKGYVSRFAPYGNAGQIDFDDWFKVCRNAHAIWREANPAAEPSIAAPVAGSDRGLLAGDLDEPQGTGAPEPRQSSLQPETGGDREFAASNELFLRRARNGYYDFLDIGTRDAGGFVVASQLGGHRGLGFDTDPASVKGNLAAGRDVVCLDVSVLDSGNVRSRFAVCHHVLEHLPNIYEVGHVIDSLARICTDFLFIAGPCFDHEDYLYRCGLKAFHSAMLDHTCRFKTLDLITLLHELGLRHYAIGVSLPIENSDSEFVVSAAAPNEVWRWESLRSLPRPRITFDPTLYRDVVCVVALDEKIDPVSKLTSYRFGQQKTERIIHVANW